MAHRHLMAVCVVCLLCAEHLPCKEHLTPTKGLDDLTNSLQISPSPYDGAMLAMEADTPGTFVYDKRKDKTKEGDVRLARTKRHSDHGHNEKHHHDETPEVTKAYIRKLFSQYSKRGTDDTSLNIEEFEQMMRDLDLKPLIGDGTTAKRENSTCMTGTDFVQKMTNPKNESETHDHKDGEDHSHHSEPSTFRERLKIDTENMLSMCPILLYHIVNRQSSMEGGGCLNSSNFIASELMHHEDHLEMEPRSTVWLYSTLSIIGVSLCGLLGVAVIPIMEKHFYHHVLQFLVALAVGTLTGDALLHLLPHAMMPISEDQEGLHETMMYRGLAAVGGIVFFYFFERFLTMVTEWRQRKQKRDKPSSRIRVVRDAESVSLNTGSAMTCKHKYSSYPYCYDEIALDTKDDHHEHQHVEEGVLNNHVDKHKSHEDHLHFVSPTEPKKINGTLSDHTIDTDNNTLSTSIDDGSIESNALCSNNNKHSATIVPALGKKEPAPEESYTIILREHQSKHHGHSHTHGHVHSPPESLSAVVWMVIMGDGLHNFTDGMAIGAAFSNNIAGGMSTAVAVFCHELPHELGDFAVLLKAGMSARQAVYYNILSSILSFFGMCVGILIGDTPEASQWIFAVAAGLFLYIALVDMMPELTSSHGKEEDFMFSQILLQFLGMTCGFSTMLLIALYEHDLKEIFAA